MIGFINKFFYNLSQSQSIIALSLIYPLHKSLQHPKSSQSSQVVSWQRIYNNLILSLLFTGWLSTDNWTETNYDWTGLTTQVKVTLRLTVSQYLFLSDSYVPVSVGRPLWREDGSVFCMCRWPLPSNGYMQTTQKTPLATLVPLLHSHRRRTATEATDCCLRIRCAGTCLQSRCLAMGLHVTISCWHCAIFRRLYNQYGRWWKPESHTV
jgi:hypothetical protein